MARIVKRTRGGPYQVTIGGETKYICGCGLSDTQPWCNGTHKITRQEEPDKLYWYDAERKAYETKDEFPNIRVPAE
jgi:CDGSH-type Zn-finger protein